MTGRVVSDGGIPRDEPSDSHLALFDSVRREVAREERAYRATRRMTEGEIPLSELQGSLTPAPTRRRAHRPRVEVEDDPASGAVFVAFSATFLLIGFLLVFGPLSAVAVLARLLAG